MVPRDMIDNKNTTYTGRKNKTNQYQRGTTASQQENSIRAPSSNKFRSMAGAGYGKTLNYRYKSQTYGFQPSAPSYSGGIGEAVALA